MKNIISNTISILSTRPLTDALLKKAREGKIIIDVVPFVELVNREEDALKEAINALAAEERHVIFTSSNAVKAVIRQLNDIPDWQIACLEGATKEAVLEWWTGASIDLTATNAAALTEKIVGQGSWDKAVFFCGDRRLDHLPDTLANAGIALEEIVVYETKEKAQKITQHYDAILFFSPSAVHSFFSLNDSKTDTVLFAIGNTTADSITQYSKHKVMVAPEPTAAAMIDFIIAYFQNEK